MTARRALLLLLLAALAGCAKNNASIEMAGLCFPPDGCSFQSTCGKFTPAETVDVSFLASPRLLVPVEVHNQMSPNADSSGHVNTNDATLEQVRVSWSVPGVAVSGVTSNITQTVPAGGTTVAFLELLDATAGGQLAAGVTGEVHGTATVKLKGVTNGGSKFETGDYRIAVTVCNGCLLGAYVCEDPTQLASNFCLHLGQWPNTFSCGAAPATFTIGGTVTNVTGAGLQLTCNGTPVNIGIGATDWTFPTPLTDGSLYVCSIATDAAGQTCSISNQNGTVSGANVANINVTCAP